MTEATVPGLLLIPDFISEEEEVDIIERVNQQQWSGLGIEPNPELKRRTQQYGYLFSYRYRKVLEEYGPLPGFVQPVVTRMMALGLMPVTPNHLLVNEYNADQGIMPHIDAPALFGPCIGSLSLLSPCVMEFTRPGHSEAIVLPRRSLLILSGSARYDYKHSISKETVHKTVHGPPIHRDKRISLTFREIIAWTRDYSSNEARGEDVGSTHHEQTRQ